MGVGMSQWSSLYLILLNVLCSRLPVILLEAILPEVLYEWIIILAMNSM